jgi:DNA-binding CsgD family transcriptional regulator
LPSRGTRHTLLSVLYGRSSELERIEDVLGEATGGEGSALLVVGDPGIGKTALLGAARERARAAGIGIVATSGVQSEARLPFAALSELAGPVLAGLSELPGPQSAAISTGLALAPDRGGTPDRLAMCLGFLGLLREAARERGLLVIVDDAHWLDPASAACLGYAARRLAGTRVALIAAARPDESTHGFDEALPVLRLDGLRRDDARALLHDRDAELGERAVDALLEATLGNPLALIELPRALNDEQRRGLAPLDPLPAPSGALGQAFERRLRLLDREERTAMVIAAASFDRAAAPVVSACRELDVPDGALERCETKGLIELDDGNLVFSHPLLRSSAYAGADLADRRRAHRALAAHCEPDASAWHLAAAALGPDTEAVAALDGAAVRATMRGAHLAAADAFERAAGLSEPTAKPGRLFAAGLAAAVGGSFDRATALLEAAAETDDPGMRATARHLLAMVRLTGGIGTAIENHDRLLADAREMERADPARAAVLFADAGVAALIAGEINAALDAAENAVRVLPDGAPPTARCQAHSMHGMGLAMSGRAIEARDAYARAAKLLGEIEFLSSAPQSIALALGGRVCTGQAAILRDEVSDLAETASQIRSLGVLPYLRQLRADAAFRLGDWGEADFESEEAATSAEVSGQVGPLVITLGVRARLLAAQGRGDEAREAAARSIEIAEPPRKMAALLWSHGALGFLELGLDRPHEAIKRLERARQIAAQADLRDPLIVPWAPDLVEAYTRIGREREAAELAAELAEQAERNATPLALALAARCEAITGADPEQSFERALALHAESEQPFERARTHLAFGARLHRNRRRGDAREHLRAASEVFEELGAVPWADRARAELRAAGAIERERVYDSDELTAQELRVALAVSRGATNREVAAELFLSPKTIEFHLGRVYRKLGIRSRTQLASKVATGEVGAGEAAAEPAAG